MGTVDLLVIVDQIDVEHAAVLNSERDTPIATNSHRPKSSHVSSEPVKPISREIQVAGPACSIEDSRVALSLLS
jgi:hypothetical protein